MYFVPLVLLPLGGYSVVSLSGNLTRCQDLCTACGRVVCRSGYRRNHQQETIVSRGLRDRPIV